MSNGSSSIERLRRKLARRMMRTIRTFGLIEEGDQIMVAISGGKDSYTLLDLLWRVRKKSPFHFGIIAVHLDQKQPGYDGRPMQAWLEQSEYEYEIVERDTYSVVLELTKPGGTYCAPCSRMRRGILYDVAERLGCNKIALGHHRDDTLETVMMNMFFSGKLQAMPAIYTTDDKRFQVIRPLIECAESDIGEYARESAFPILPCNLCGSQSGLQRDRMAALLNQLEETIPNVREVMLAALKNVRTTHLLDTTVSSTRNQVIESDDLLDACGSGATNDSPLITITG